MKSDIYLLLAGVVVLSFMAGHHFGYVLGRKRIILHVARYQWAQLFGRMAGVDSQLAQKFAEFVKPDDLMELWDDD